MNVGRVAREWLLLRCSCPLYSRLLGWGASSPSTAVIVHSVQRYSSSSNSGVSPTSVTIPAPPARQDPSQHPPSRKRPIKEPSGDTSVPSQAASQATQPAQAAPAAASSSTKRARFESSSGGAPFTPSSSTASTLIHTSAPLTPFQDALAGPHYVPLPPTRAISTSRAYPPPQSASSTGSQSHLPTDPLAPHSNPESPATSSSAPAPRRYNPPAFDPRSPSASLVPFPSNPPSFFAESSSTRMFDLDESVRALYFAPTPMLVLDHNRRIRMMNRPCESIFLMTGVSCMGQMMEKLIIENHRADFYAAIQEASQVRATAAWAPPVLTRLTFLQDDQKMFSADMAISAWHPTDEVFSETFNSHFAKSLTSDTEKQAGNEQPPFTTPNRSDSIESRGAPLPHESYFTISIVPTRLAERRMSPADLQLSKAEQLKEGVFHTIETAIMALSSDGSTVIRNRACDEMLKMFEKKNPQDKPKKQEQPKPHKEGVEVDLSWLSDVMVCYTEDFSEPFPEQNWPIYRAAILGQFTKPVRIGCVATDTGVRRVYEIVAKPIRDAGGFGHHIGGVITLVDVTDTEKKYRLEVEKKGEEYFRTICDSMPQMLWTAGPDGTVDWFNEGWYRFTGLDSQTLFSLGWQQCFHEDDMAETNAHWSHSLRTGEPYQVMYRARRHDGVWKWMLGRALPVRESGSNEVIKWYGSCTDCDSEVKALEASRKSQTQLTSVINHAHVTIWAIDLDAIITIAEGPGVRSLRLAPGTPNGSDGDGSGSGSGNSLSGSLGAGTVNARSDESKDAESQTNSQSVVSGPGKRAAQRSMIGRSIYEVWDSPGIREAIGRALNGESVVQEMEIEGRWFRTQYTPQREESYDHEANEGTIIGVVGASMDITDRRRAELKLEESMHERSRALAAETAAKEASRIKSEFLANMSHEIRTPIAGVIGLSELLCDTQLSQEQRDFAENIQRSADALLTVINDILDFEKLELGKMDLEKTAFNLNVVIMDTQKMLTFATQKKGLEFRNECQLNFTGQIVGDAGRLRQVLTNLLTNAIKFTAVGSITLRVIETYEDQKSLHVHFEVRDTGCGISQATLKRLFQPFSQADPSFARRFGGTGLGLSICKNLVDLMGGTIGLESVENKGSNAWFSIPFEKVQTLESSGDSSPDEEAIPEIQMDEATSTLGVSENPLQRPRKDIWILVAEDNLINAQIALRTLKKMGFSCKVAKDGLEAIDEVGKRSYDLILMDCHMPNCDGYEATKRLRKSDSVDIRTTPIIAMTASAIRGDREKCLAAGMSDYLSKPVKSAALESTLVKWLFDPSTRQSLSRYVAPPMHGDYFGSKRPGGGLEITIPGPGEPGSPPRLIERDSTETVMGPHSIQSGRRGSFNPIAEREAVAAEIAASATPVGGVSSRSVEFASLSSEAGSATPEVISHEGHSAISASDEDGASGAEGSSKATPQLGKSSKRRLLRKGPVKVIAEDVVPTKLRPAPKVLSAPELALAGKPPIFVRRSSREQGGLGRDLEGEVVRAMEDGADGPSLGVAMEERPEEELTEAEAGHIHVTA